MIKVENIQTFGIVSAMRGMRNPLNSWHLNDSFVDDNGVEVIGPRDLDLLCRLSKAGTSHRKALRMMHIQMDITAPLYWWKDYDTYKVATVANGCSTMHKIHDKEFTLTDFSMEKLDGRGLMVLDEVVQALNYYRTVFNEDKSNKKAWECMIQLLPSSYNQKRTVDINYETAMAIIFDRRLHKLEEFRDICNIFLQELPYMKEICEAVKGGEKL